MRGMARDTAAWLVLDRADGDLEGQIYRALRARILSGALRPGDALPSTRALAALLGTARSTVVAGYDRLRAEGHLVGRAGAATRVADMPAVPAARAAPLPPPRHEPERFAPFRPGLPDLDLFPARTWARCLAARARHLRLHDLGYGEETGLPALRTAIADHVARRRAVVADPAQVIVLPSTAAAIDLIARITLAPGDIAWIEDPGYPTAQALLRRAGAAVVPVPVDAQGIDPAAAPAGRPRLIHVSPSHQYPTGVAMSLARRMALLDHAARHDALIVEDDYDSEFHYAGRPLAALQGLGLGSTQVAYVGTFSKVLAPGLRVAYAILPPHLLGPAQAAIRLAGASVALHVQAAMADFIADGHLAAHIRRMRRIYHARMEDTAAMITAHHAAHLAVGARDGGLQLALMLRDGQADDRTLAAALHRQGLGAMPLSTFYLGAPRSGLLLGIACATPDRIARLDAALTGQFGAPGTI
jgi:GntR family transcriptional regulator / MocR family aminotransferase